MSEVIIHTLRRIIRQKGVADAIVPEQPQKGIGRFEERAALINRAVHVEGDMADFSQSFVHSLSCSKGAMLLDDLDSIESGAVGRRTCQRKIINESLSRTGAVGHGFEFD